jgi:GH24 family phage-related lysozyme (muramidase)
MKITKAKAESLLRRDVLRFQACVTKNVHVALNQGQFDALVSLAYNIGEGNDPKTPKGKRGPSGFRDSTLLKLLNQGRYDSACAQFDRWIHANGKKSAGLQRRRDAEQALFRSGDTDDAPISTSTQVECAPLKPLGNSKTLVGVGTAGALGTGAMANSASDLVEKHSSLIDTVFSSSAVNIWLGVGAALALAYVAYRYLKDREERF